MLSNTKLKIGRFYSGLKTIKILKDGKWVKAVPRAAAPYGRQLKINVHFNELCFFSVYLRELYDLALFEIIAIVNLAKYEKIDWSKLIVHNCTPSAIALRLPLGIIVYLMNKH